MCPFCLYLDLHAFESFSYYSLLYVNFRLVVTCIYMHTAGLSLLEVHGPLLLSLYMSQ